jgi:hypothetical protein
MICPHCQKCFEVKIKFEAVTKEQLIDSIIENGGKNDQKDE